jgi:hypothetical protein
MDSLLDPNWPHVAPGKVSESWRTGVLNSETRIGDVYREAVAGCGEIGGLFTKRREWPQFSIR